MQLLFYGGGGFEQSVFQTLRREYLLLHVISRRTPCLALDLHLYLGYVLVSRASSSP